MENERKYYVFCEDNCKFESMTKEQIITAIAEATGHTPEDIDAAFITKIKEQNRNKPLKFWIGTQAEYNALEEIDPNCFYIFSDSDELSDIEQLARDTATEICQPFVTDIANLKSDVANVKTELAKKGVVLYDGANIETGTTYRIDNLTDYTLVKVNVAGCGTVICTVEVSDGNITVKGLGNGLLGGNNAVYVASVLLKGYQNNFINNNSCCMFTNNNGTVSAPSIAYVNKIIGIM